MKKGGTTAKFLCTILAITLVLSFAPLTAAEAAGSFSDISQNDYYYTEVTAMYSQGVINGYGDGTFLPKNPVKNAEALKLVCSTAGVGYAGYSGKNSPWYSDVWAWAKDKNIVSPKTDPNANATREQLCEYIVAVYKLEAGASSKVFSDTDSEAAGLLYGYGIIKGIPNGDGTVSFGGEQNVKRCDTCIMLYRLSTKIPRPDWAETFAVDLSHYKVSKPTSFDSFNDYVKAWDYMLVNAVFEDTFTADFTCTEAQLNKIMDDIETAYYYAMFDYLEYASFLSQCSYGVTYLKEGTNCSDIEFTLNLSNSDGLTQSQIKSQIGAFNSTCAKIVTSLYETGQLKKSMTDKEKAHVLYIYTAYHTKYDESYTYYTGYDAAVRGTAVCMGYTAMYNYICNLAGVKMESMTGYVDGEGHAWSRIYSGGTYYNIDVTWADPVPDQPNYCDEKWFWVTDSYLKTCEDPRTFDIETLVHG